MEPLGLRLIGIKYPNSQNCGKNGNEIHFAFSNKSEGGKLLVYCFTAITE